MWFVPVTVYTLEISCIFLFIVYCVIAFLMVMYNTCMEELRRCIIIPDVNLEAEFSVENHESMEMEKKLKVLTEKLTDKERVLQHSHSKIKDAEKVLNDLENKTLSCRDRYHPLIAELKKDIRKTEDEVKTLQSQISSLSIRRKILRSEVIKQQEDYKKLLNSFTTELENKKTLFSSGLDKLRHPRFRFSYCAEN